MVSDFLRTGTRCGFNILCRDWYRAAQTQALPGSATPPVFTPIDERDEELDPTAKPVDDEGSASARASVLKSIDSSGLHAETASARRELRIYELAALVCCFTFPLLAAWLLHGIRSQLSRPSEGLVSDYNLTIFILVSEIRPLSHLIKMVQKRTLFLQRKVSSDLLADSRRVDSQQLKDLSHRLEELEAHVADRIDTEPPQIPEPVGKALDAKIPTVVRTEVQKTVQPEVDALNRAMRRYEKRTTISAVQFESRLQDLEARLNDVVSLAAAVQRNADRKTDSYLLILTNWACAMVVVPAQYLLHLLSIPSKMANAVLAVPKQYFSKTAKSSAPKDARTARRSAPLRSGDREKRSKQTAS